MTKKYSNSFDEVFNNTHVEEETSKVMGIRNDDLEEAIIKGRKSKTQFTVSIQTDMNDKFEEIMLYYQNKFAYGKVYKHYVLQLIIDEVHTRMKKQNLF